MKYKFENVRGFKKRKLKKKDIVLMRGDENYTIFHLTNGTKFTLAKTLKQCEGIFEDFNFVRSHRSFIVNIDHCQSIENSFIVLSDNLTAKVSRRKMSLVLASTCGLNSSIID